MTGDEDAFRKLCGPTLEATKRWNARSSRQLLRDDKIEKLMIDLFYSGRVGLAGAEYNLEKAGLIEMVQGHVAGIMRRDDQYWCDCRWTLTDKGRRATMAQLERVILREPPAHVAEQDAAEVADDIANVPSGDEPDQRWRILTHLDQRAERIRQKMKKGAINALCRRCSDP